MAREMYLAGVDPEDLKKSQEAPPPQTMRQKWDNYWYHHKWATIAGACALILAVVFVGQMVTRNEPDYTVLVVTEKQHNSYTLAPMEQLLEKYGEDLDGDGEVEVRLVPCYLGATEYTSAQEQLANFQILQSHLAAGDVMLFAFEAEYFGWFMGEMAESGSQFLTPLGTDGVGVSEDGCYWNWSQDDRVTANAAFEVLPQQMCFGVRVAQGTAARRGEEQQQCLKLLRALIRDTPTQRAE